MRSSSLRARDFTRRSEVRPRLRPRLLTLSPAAPRTATTPTAARRPTVGHERRGMGEEREKGRAACLRDGLAAAQHEGRPLWICSAAALAVRGRGLLESRPPPLRALLAKLPTGTREAVSLAPRRRTRAALFPRAHTGRMREGKPRLLLNSARAPCTPRRSKGPRYPRRALTFSWYWHRPRSRSRAATDSARKIRGSFALDRVAHLRHAAAANGRARGRPPEARAKASLHRFWQTLPVVTSIGYRARCNPKAVESSSCMRAKLLMIYAGKTALCWGCCESCGRTRVPGCSASFVQHGKAPRRAELGTARRERGEAAGPARRARRRVL